MGREEKEGKGNGMAKSEGRRVMEWVRGRGDRDGREGKEGKRGMEMEWDGKDPLAGAYTHGVKSCIKHRLNYNRNRPNVM